MGRSAAALPEVRAAPLLSVVVPTRNEAASVRPLLDALQPALRGLPCELIFVDDSTDETPAVLAAAAASSSLPVDVCHRAAADRTDGLGGAVKRGFERATGEFVAVMDADLQHPPALLPVLLETARRESADVVVASRFAAGGGTGEFGLARRLVSRASAAAARLFFPRRLAAVSDPMSGFFLVRRDRLRPEELRPRGFKILLEVLVRCRPLRIAEAPYTFGERVAGTSKASLREGLNYLAHLMSLRFGQKTLRLARFAVVGSSGVVVNMGLLALLTEEFGLFYLASAIVAAETSICSNYLLSELWVFRARGSGVGLLGRFTRFLALNNAALGVSIPLLGLLVSGLHLQYLVANLIAIVALTLARFAVADALIWRERRPRRHLPRRRPIVLRTAPVRVRRS